MFNLRTTLLAGAMVLAGTGALAQTVPFNVSTTTLSCTGFAQYFSPPGWKLPSGIQGMRVKGAWATFWGGDPPATGPSRAFIDQMRVGVSGPVNNPDSFNGTGFPLGVAGQFETSTHPVAGTAGVGQGPVIANDTQIGLVVQCSPAGALFGVNAGLTLGP